ncbi:MAG: UDP-N-acetylmuramoyl-L-alanine--D-glutamate ligase [Clostridia bacterium]|nr:UDP-N-acetylmuramoyl-L-alanine--D-glutamate ligase [Clostridia bacterium]
MLNEYTASFRGKKVGFVGLGVSNLPVIKRFLASGAVCTVRDKKDITKEYGFLAEEGVEFICGEGYLEGITESLLFLSPAVRPDLPGIVEARANGTVVTSEMQEFFRLCPCKKIAVTGSDGKTTTTTLIAKLLEAAGKRVFLGGNIGVNLFDSLDSIGADDFAVVELSSFQLMKMDISPDIAVITNIAPNHLDWHRDMAEYVDSKCNIFRFQNKSGVLVLNADDEYCCAFAKEARGEVRFVSGEGSERAEFIFDSSGIKRGGKLIVPDGGIKIVGRHNRYNYCEAYAATCGFVPVECLKKVAAEFGGVEHRIELVRELDGVKYYNSSIDSSPSRTKACLESFKDKVIVISGGYDKHIPYDPLGELFVRKVKFAVLCGATAPKIAQALDNAGFGDYVMINGFEEAVDAARAHAQKGDCVVLSPASASFDMFKNFAERGNRFKEIVNGFREGVWKNCTE